MSNNKFRIKMTVILSFCLMILVTPFLQAHNSAALSVSSISKTEGAVSGGDEIIIKGEGFIKEQADQIWEVIGFTGALCRAGNGEDKSKKSSQPIDLLGDIIITKTGLMLGRSYDDDHNLTLINLTEEYNLGVVDSIHDTGYEKIIHTKDNRVHSVLYSGCSVDNISLYTDIFSPGDNHIIGVEPYNGIYVKSGNDYFLINYRNYSNSSNPPKLDLDEPIVSVENNILTMQSGKKILLYNNHYNENILLDITSYIGEENVIDIRDNTLILSSGKVIDYATYSGSETTVNTQFVDLLEGEEIEQFFGYPELGVILSKSGKLFTTSGDWGYGSQQTVYSLTKINTPSDVDEIIDGVVYLKDGSIYGEVNPWTEGGVQNHSEQFRQTFEEDKISGIFYSYGQIIITESDKIYIIASKYNDETWESEEIIQLLDYNLLPGDSLKSISENGMIITTDFGRILSIHTADEESFEISDITNQTTKDFPKVPTDQVMKLYFGDAEATEFEIIDENTIRAIVPANNTGLYNISFLARDSNDIYKTTLNYRYTGSDEEVKLPIITAPNTGYQMN